MKRRRDYIEFRRYDLSGSEPVLVMNVDTWKKCYPDGTRILHFHNLMEVGYCHEGDGSLIIDNKEYPFGNDMISIIPANMTHGTFSENDHFGHWHYLFFDVESIISELWGDNQVFLNEFLSQVNQSGFFFHADEHLRYTIKKTNGHLIIRTAPETAAWITTEHVYHSMNISGGMGLMWM